MPTVDGVTEGLVDPLLNRDRSRPLVVLRLTAGLLAASDNFYAPLAERTEALLGSLRTGEQRSEFLLGMWSYAPPHDWSKWAGHVEDNAHTKGRTTAALGVVRHLFESFRAADQDTQGKVQAFVRLLADPLARLTETQIVDGLLETTATTLGAYPWSEDSALRVTQEDLHAALRALERVCEGCEDRVQELRGTNLVGAVEAGIGDPVEWLRGLAGMARELEADQYEAILAQLPEPDPDTDPTLYGNSLWVELTIRRRLSEKIGVSPDPADYRDRMVRVLGLRNPNGTRRHSGTLAMAEWLSLGPEPRDVAPAIRAAGPRPTPGEVRNLTLWARTPSDRSTGANKTRSRNTRLVRALIARGFEPAHWVQAVAGEEVVEAQVVRQVETELFRQRGRRRLDIDERLNLVGAIVGLGPRTRGARTQVAELCCRLLKKDQPANNLKVVVRVCGSLEPDYDGKIKLGKAVADHCARHEIDVTKGQAEALAHAGIRLPESRLTRGAKRAAKGAGWIIDKALGR
jgi:hypothetical protein